MQIGFKKKLAPLIFGVIVRVDYAGITTVYKLAVKYVSLKSAGDNLFHAIPLALSYQLFYPHLDHLLRSDGLARKLS
jgi:hypothetical protein